MKRAWVICFVLALLATLPIALASTITLAPGSSVSFTGTTGQDGSTFPGTLVADTGAVGLTPGLGSSVTATGREEVFLDTYRARFLHSDHQQQPD